MAGIPKQRGVLYLDKHTIKLAFGFRPDIFVLEIPPQIIGDIEVYDSAGLDTLIGAFMKQHAITPTQFTILLSDAIVFDKPLTTIAAVDRAEEVKTFLDTVPFDEVASKIYSLETESFIAATNNQLIHTIRKALKNIESATNSVLPLKVLGKPYNTKTDLDKELSEYVLKKFDDLRQLDISDPDENSAVSYFHYDNTPTKQSKTTLPILLSVFAGLIGILGFLVWMQRTPQKPTNADTTVIPTAFLSPTAEPTVVVPTLSATESASLHFEQYSVEIHNGSGPISTGEKARSAFLKMGFKNIFVNNVESLSTASLVVFSTRVPAEVKTAVLNDIQKSIPEYSNIPVKESTDTQSDVILTLGKP